MAVPWGRRDQGCGCMWGLPPLSTLLEPVPPWQLPEEGTGWDGVPGPPSSPELATELVLLLGAE